MGSAWHSILAVSYLLTGVGLCFLLPAIATGLDRITAILIGVVFVLACALGHETFRRHTSETQTMRRLIALKKAYDQTKQDLQQAREDIAQVGGRTPPPPPPRGTDTPWPSAPPSAWTAQAETPPATDTPRAPQAPESIADLPRDEPQFDRTNAFSQHMPAGEEKPSPGRTPTLRDKKADEAEIKVLHSLVEQLYGEDTDAMASARAQAEAEATAGEKKTSKSRKQGLRVVGRPKHNGNGLLDVVKESLHNERVDLYLQPIVSLPQRKRRFFECFSRIRAADGAVLQPEQYKDLAKQAGLEATIDNMLLLRSVQLLRKVRAHDFSMMFFCNVSPNSLGDRTFLQEFIDYMENHQDLAPSLVLELNQHDVKNRLDTLAPHLKHLGGLGYRFALDGVTDFDLDMPKLTELYFRFVKVDASAVIERLKSSPAGGEMRAFKQQLDDKGIDLIVERIETEQMLIELLDFNIDYGQGFLFGEPRISKDPTTGLRAV